MKIEKYVFFLPEALRLAAARLDIRPLTNYDLLVLYILRHYSPITFMGVLRKIQSYYYPASHMSVYRSLDYLKSVELINHSQKSYTLSPLGREYLSLVRRYLLHKRI